MATYEATYDNRTSFPIFPVIGILLLISIVFAIAVQLNLHSIEAHNETEAVDQACGHNVLERRQNISTGRFYEICGMNDGSFGIRILIKQIDGTYRKVTSFVRKSSGKPVMNLNKVLEYVGGEPWTP